MTVYYDSDRDAVVENHPDYVSEDDDGCMVMSVDDMPDRKLGNLKRAVEDAQDAQDGDRA